MIYPIKIYLLTSSTIFKHLRLWVTTLHVLSNYFNFVNFLNFIINGNSLKYSNVTNNFSKISLYQLKFSLKFL